MAGPPGVNVVGYFNHVLGIGESARLFAGALRAADVEHTLAAIEPVGAGKPLVTEPKVPWLADRRLPHDVTVVWCNPDRYGIDVEPGRLRGRLVGRWAWELGTLPEHWRAGAARVDEIWTPSRFVAAAVQSATDTRVRVVSPAIPLREAPPLDRERWGLAPGVPLFLFMFDHASTLARKNPLGLIDAFGRAFDGNGEAALLVKGLNAGSDRCGAEAVRAAARANRSVRVFNGMLPAVERDALLAGCDCYVSLHRSEGFGLTLAEALSHARPLVATGFGGNVEFADEETAAVVRAAPAPVDNGVPIYPEGAMWSEPDLDHAAQLMRRVLEAPDEARARGERGRERIRTAHSPETVGETAREAIDRLAA